MRKSLSASGLSGRYFRAGIFGQVFSGEGGVVPCQFRVFWDVSAERIPFVKGKCSQAVSLRGGLAVQGKGLRDIRRCVSIAVAVIRGEQELPLRVACLGGAADAGCFQFGGVPSAQATRAVGDAFPFTLGQAVKIGSLNFSGGIALPGKFVPNGEGVQPAPAVFHVCGAAGIEAAGADARQGVNATAVYFGFSSDVHLSICSSNAAAV